MVAMAAERVMAKVKYEVLYRQRRKVLKHARDLARSGEHAGHQAPAPAEPNPKLEAALDRWRRAAERQGAGK
jgi:hypothetical protein